MTREVGLVRRVGTIRLELKNERDGLDGKVVLMEMWGWMD